MKGNEFSNFIKIKNPFLPRDTKEVFSSIRNYNNPEFNFYILYNLADVIQHGKTLKIRINKYIDKYQWDKEFLNKITERQDGSVKSFENRGYRKNKIEAVVEWRMVIGLGAPHPQETSMTLHHIYGIPYIPASAIKGAVRHYRIRNIFEEIFKDPSDEELHQINCLEKILENADLTNKDETKRDDKLDYEKFKEKFKVRKKREGEHITISPKKELFDFFRESKDDIIEFQNVFGTQGKRGEVFFLDAYPIDEVNLKIDGMNPHYGPYYQDSTGKVPPADYHNPKPIKFLTVEKTKFRFYLLSKDDSLLKTAENWLKEALKKHGIGAKTSIGYGSFENHENKNST